MGRLRTENGEYDTYDWLADPAKDPAVVEQVLRWAAFQKEYRADLSLAIFCNDLADAVASGKVKVE